MPEFSHLHCHTQFSLLDGAADISTMFKKAKADNMKAVAITDHGNMFGAFKFVAEAGKAGVKPIVGCEFYVVEDRHRKTFTKDQPDSRFHQLLLAKNAEGYRNLTKLCSLGYIEGLYSKWPRIDKQLILQYHKGLIATTCCIGAMVPQTILNKGEEAAEQEFRWWLDLFGEDYYIELQRHKMQEQVQINEVLLKFSKKYNVKTIATNDSHYVNQQDSDAHDSLLCVNTGELKSTPVGDGKGYRFGFPNNEFYFKSQEEMNTLFADLPEAIDNTNEIVDKVDTLKLKQDILLPNFPVPPEFQLHAEDTLNQWEYLKHLTFEGARTRYIEMTPEIEERLNFELFTVKTMGFAGYFLIVADFIKAGRDMGVFVGPGRGSAAGSAVAYCIGITNIDPIKYNLLFERFLNPDRKSMPDIDTDFDDEGRQKVIDYVVDKYGRNQVAQIVTYGTMAARTSIQDVARVLDYPIADMNGLKKLMPEKLGLSLRRALKAPLLGDDSLKEKEGLSSDEMELIKQLREVAEGTDTRARILKEAEILEGSVRNTGIHAAGIIIAPKDLTEIIPVCTLKDSELLVTQYEGKIIEDAGVIKMDFLGLKTLTIIKDALRLIKENHGVEIDIDTIPLNDAKTLELYQRGETNGTFQFESVGMQKYLKELKPDKFEDLIAMNALYRPGPLEYIPNFIKRKHGLEAISYDIPDMEEYLADTYGITVYQEQVMLLSQKLAGFTKGDADVLRKAMGKKDRATLDKMKGKFMEGAIAKNMPQAKLDKVWTDWEAFAQYAFNKSHSTCYAFVAFQTAYMKANYPSEYMSAVLINNQNNMDKVTFFMEECRRMGIHVLGPDINESDIHFSVNKKGEIRMGLGALKGLGEAAASAIIQERKENGAFSNIFDMAGRVNLRAVNKKAFESLALAGAFDSFGQFHRAQYLHNEGDGIMGVEKIARYGIAFQDSLNSSQQSLFGDVAVMELAPPTLPECEQWSQLELLKREKEVVGIYISGHPLDEFKYDIAKFCNSDVKTLNTVEADKVKGKEFTLAGIINRVQKKVSQQGKPWGAFSLEDYGDVLKNDIRLFSEDYLKHQHMLENGMYVFLRVKYEERWRGDSGDPSLKVMSIQLLSDIRQKMAKGVQLSLNVGEINEAGIEELVDVVKKYPGSGKLRIRLLEAEESMDISMQATKLSIDPSNKFFEELKKIAIVSEAELMT